MSEAKNTNAAAATPDADAFLAEIRAVLEKHNASYDEADDYDGADNHTGTRKYVAVGGRRFELDELFPTQQSATTGNADPRT